MDQLTDALVRVSVEDRVAVVTIDHPPANFLNPATLEALEAAVDAVIADDAVKAVVVTGAVKVVFVAGADIAEFAKMNADQAERICRQGQTLFAKIENAPKPFVAAINGLALGGGLELALACHLRVAGERAKLGLPEINLGLIPGWGGTQRLPRLVGQAKALELILTGDSISAQEAYRLNLVNLVVPRGEELTAALALARKLTLKGKLAMEAALRTVTQGARLSLDEGLAMEAKAFAVVTMTADAREGVSAFVEKRPPTFRDA